MKILILIFAIILLKADGALSQQKKNEVIQFDISKILNARPVTTLYKNKLITWSKGIDGGGIADGYLTISAALFNNDKNPHALPDNPIFPANESHPEIKLHYSNEDTYTNQAFSIKSEGGFSFKVPKAKYKAIFLAITSAEGASRLRIVFTYTGGAEVQEIVLPDYYQDIAPGDPKLCYLVHDLAKWGPKNNMTEKDHHNIDILKIKPNKRRILKSIRVSKMRPGYLVFWAGAGVKAQ